MSYVCRKCGGKDHISICKFEEKNDNPQALVSHVGPFGASVLDLDNKNSCNSRILFDTGSQKFYHGKCEKKFV